MIDGSPHKEGTTARLIAAFVAALPPGAAVERFCCFDQSPLPCDDCRYCHTAAGCSKPDLGNFYEILERADILVFAAPVYNRSFPAPMKALIDRLQRYWVARFIRGERPPIARPKQAVLLLSSGGPEDPSDLIWQQLRPVLTILHATLVQTVCFSNTDARPYTQESFQEAAAAARALLSGLNRTENNF